VGNCHILIFLSLEQLMSYWFSSIQWSYVIGAP
jgi:hypothetical protein